MNDPDNPAYPFAGLFVSHVDYESSGGLFFKARTAMRILYSFEAKKKMATLLKKIKPDLVHLNNFSYQISPSVLDEIKKHHIPTVMTMREYKMVSEVRGTSPAIMNYMKKKRIFSAFFLRKTFLKKAPDFGRTFNANAAVKDLLSLCAGYFQSFIGKRRSLWFLIDKL